MSPTSEQPSVVLPVISHDVPKFGGLGDLSSAKRVSPPTSSDHTTEEECASEEDEDDSEDDNPITSTPMPQSTGNKQVRKMEEMVSIKIPSFVFLTQLADLSISVHSFTMVSSPAALDITTQYMFVEYELLGLHHDDLETPSQPLPLPGHSCTFESSHCKLSMCIGA